jgi:hypothetical protein
VLTVWRYPYFLLERNKEAPLSVIPEFSGA